MMRFADKSASSPAPGPASARRSRCSFAREGGKVAVVDLNEQHGDADGPGDRRGPWRGALRQVRRRRYRPR